MVPQVAFRFVVGEVVVSLAAIIRGCTEIKMVRGIIV